MSIASSRILALAAVAALTSACGIIPPCVAEGNRFVVDVNSSKDLNDAGAGPQHVRFQVWAVKDKEMFESARADALAEAEGAPAFQRQGMGKLFEAESNYIKPSGTAHLILRVAEDKEFAFIGIAVLFPEPKKLIVPVDCNTHPGYTHEGDTHKVVFSLGRQSIDAGTPR